jgi:hypothetical protein
VHAINRLVGPDDVVAELGAQLRDVSTAICDRAKAATLVDGKRGFPKSGRTATADPNRVLSITNDAANEQTRTRAMRMPNDQEQFYPNVATFTEINELDDWRKAFLTSGDDGKQKQYTVFVVDVNAIVGNDLEWTALSIVREFSRLFDTSCSTVLVKSESLNMWANRIVCGQPWILGKVDGPTERRTGLPVKSPKVIATVGVEQYRQTIVRTVRPGDAVLEVGCHLGTTTKILQDVASSYQGGYAIGVDIGGSIIKAASDRHVDLFFSVGDAWKTANLLRIQQQFLSQASTNVVVNRRLGFDVVFVDIGGLSGGDGLLEALVLLSALLNALEPRSIVIKSLCMQRLTTTLVPYWQVQSKLQEPKDDVLCGGG